MLKLRSVEIKERSEDKSDIFIGKANLKDFNLLIGDNAQGKTRFFNTIAYISSISYNKAHPIRSNFWSKWEFDEIKPSSINKIRYDVRVIGLRDKNDYQENIYKNNKLIFSTRQSILIDEAKKGGKKRIENFYLPANTPAIVSITEPEFRTIGLIRSFFQRIIYVSSNKSREIRIDPNSLIPNKEGTNIGSVLNNWKDKYPEIFREVVNELKASFNFINEIYFTDQESKEGFKTKLLTFKEDAVAEPIMQNSWSDGLYRMLFLIMAVKVPFIERENIHTPSLILIDEIENGLDFKSLKFILDFYKDYSDEYQFALSSHSPLVCELVHPKHWIVVKRSGAEIRFISPADTEKDLDRQLDLYKQKHWELYTKHISSSNTY